MFFYLLIYIIYFLDMIWYICLRAKYSLLKFTMSYINSAHLRISHLDTFVSV